jgi:hypothetical protein
VIATAYSGFYENVVGELLHAVLLKCSGEAHCGKA